MRLGLRSKIAAARPCPPLVLTSRRPLPRNFVSSLPLFPRQIELSGPDSAHWQRPRWKINDGSDDPRTYVEDN